MESLEFWQTRVIIKSESFYLEIKAWSFAKHKPSKKIIESLQGKKRQ